MSRLRFLTAGESHGPALTGVIEGLPANMALTAEDIDRELIRRQKGYGRGGRMKIESDRVEIISGVRWGRTIGSPISLRITNRDWKNWSVGMSPKAEDANTIDAVTKVRPGHADLSGSLKYNQADARNILERSSARETAMRVALGAIAKRFLADFGVSIGSYVIGIGGVGIEPDADIADFRHSGLHGRFEELFTKAEASEVRCPDVGVSEDIKKAIDAARDEGDTLGGRFAVYTTGLPTGLGSHIQWDRRLNGRIAQAIMSIQAIKAVEFGIGFAASRRTGSKAMDEIFFDKTDGFYRLSNNAGGIEGGMTNGMPIFLTAAMKPIPTLRRQLNSVDMITRETSKAIYERSDVCAVPAASVIAEAMTALILADAFIEKFGGDSMEETGDNYKVYVSRCND